MPRAIISDQGSHFCNRSLASLLQKYGVVHRVAITFHPQTNEQAKVFNREIKQVLQKVMQPNRTIYRTPLGMSPYRMVFSKACHLLVEIKHHAYRAVKGCNMALDEAIMERKL